MLQLRLYVEHQLRVCCERSGDHRELHVLTHSFPTRRSSDLAATTPPTSRTAPTSRWASTTCATTWRRGSRTRCSGATATAASTRSTRSSSTRRSEEHTSELQSLMLNSYPVSRLTQKTLNHLYS